MTMILTECYPEELDYIEHSLQHSTSPTLHYLKQGSAQSASPGQQIVRIKALCGVQKYLENTNININPKEGRMLSGVYYCKESQSIEIEAEMCSIGDDKNQRDGGVSGSGSGSGTGTGNGSKSKSDDNPGDRKRKFEVEGDQKQSKDKNKKDDKNEGEEKGKANEAGQSDSIKNSIRDKNPVPVPLSQAVSQVNSVCQYVPHSVAFCYTFRMLQ